MMCPVHPGQILWKGTRVSPGLLYCPRCEHETKGFDGVWRFDKSGNLEENHGVLANAR